MLLATCGKILLFILALLSTYVSKDVFWFFYWWTKKSKKLSQPGKKKEIDTSSSNKNNIISIEPTKKIESPQTKPNIPPTREIDNNQQQQQQQRNSNSIQSIKSHSFRSDCTTTSSSATTILESDPCHNESNNNEQTSASNNCASSSNLTHQRSSSFSNCDETFRKACEFMNSKEFESITSTLPETEKLAFYGSYMQATYGPCDQPQPPITNFSERSKWNSWSQLGKMRKEDAQKYYLQQLLRLKRKWNNDATKKQVVEHLSFLDMSC